MKKIACEMCGSNDLLKTDGVFECQHCGTKYTLEEARKMMIDGPVEVKGKVAIDHSAVVKNKIKNMINEYNHANNDLVIELALEILEVDPDCIEAKIYKGLATGWKTSIADNTLSVTSDELIQAIKMMDEKTDDNIVFSERMVFILQEMKKMSKAMFNLYTNYYNERGKEVDKFSKLAKEASDDATREGWNAVGSAFSSPGVSSSYSRLADTYRQNATHYMNTAVEIEKDRVNVYNSGIALVGTALNVIGKIMIASMNLTILDTGEKLELHPDFLPAFDEYLLNYKEYLTKGTMNDYKELVSMVEGLRAKLINDFWNDHKDEKAKMDKEIEENKKIIEEKTAKIKECKERIDFNNLQRCAKTPSLLKSEELEAQIDILKQEKSKLGLFDKKGKEPINQKIKALQAEIDNLDEAIVDENAKLNENIDKNNKQLNIEIMKAQNDINVAELRNKELATQILDCVIK